MNGERAWIMSELGIFWDEGKEAEDAGRHRLAADRMQDREQAKSMTGARLREQLAAARVDLREAAALLGYASHNSLRQVIDGKANLPADKAAWLERYLEFRIGQAREETGWREKHPPPWRKQA